MLRAVARPEHRQCTPTARGRERAEHLCEADGSSGRADACGHQDDRLPHQSAV